eukprot:jgi/Chlat1/4930/Chrsp31S04847
MNGRQSQGGDGGGGGISYAQREKDDDSCSLPESTSAVRLFNGVTAAPYGRWTTGFWAFWADGYLPCLAGCFLPCLEFGRNAEAIDGSNRYVAAALCCSLCLVGFRQDFGLPFACGRVVYMCLQRGKLRAKYGLPGHFTWDFVVSVLCCCCSLCQNARELKVRSAFHDMAQAKAHKREAPALQKMTNE